MTLLTNHGYQNLHFASPTDELHMDYRWATLLSSRIPHFDNGNSTIDNMGKNTVASALRTSDLMKKFLARYLELTLILGNGSLTHLLSAPMYRKIFVSRER